MSSLAIVRLALRYGIAGFGGGYSVLAQLRRDLVERRKWLDADQFLVLAELSKSLPGTPATSLIALLGQRVGGVRTGVLAAGAFLLPSMVLMMACGAAYSRMRGIPALAVFFDGMNAAMVGIVAATTLDLGRSAIRSRIDLAAALLCTTILATRVVSEPVVAVVAICVGVVRAIPRAREQSKDIPPPPSERLHAASPFWLMILFGAGATALPALARVFLPIGALTFGGGLAMVPAIEHTVVAEQHWLDPRGFADAVALGQITPGPVAICATFIGYRVGGLFGALVATVAMFGPALAIALAVGHSVERFRRSPLVIGALRALAPAVIGMLGAATFGLARAGIGGWVGAVIACATFLVLVRKKISPFWFLLAGGSVQLLAARF